MNYVDEYEFVRNYFAANPDALETWKEKFIEYRKSKNLPYNYDVSSLSETLLILIVHDLHGRGFDSWKEWITQVDPVLDTLAEAVRKPVFVHPCIFGDQGIFDPFFFQLFQSLSWSLTQRAIYRIDNGDIDGAIDDFITCRRLGQHVKIQGFANHYLTGLVYERMAVNLGPNANPEVPVSAEQIRRLLREMDEFSASRPFEEIWDMERFIRLSVLQKIIHLPKNQRRGDFAFFFSPPSVSPWITAAPANWWEELTEPRNYLHLLGYNWNTIMKRFNEAHDEVWQGTWTAPTLSESYTVWWTQKGRSEEVAKAAASALLCPELIKQEYKKYECCMKIQKLVLTMLLYEKEHGTLPPTFSVDANGTPLHSWRVLLLPYFDEEEKELYENIRLNEPWNSDWNKQFHETETLYECSCQEQTTGTPKPKLKGRTDYTVFVGDETPFAEKPDSGRFSKDFGANTILIAERKAPVCWMDPTQETTQNDAEKYIVPASVYGSNYGFKSGAASFIVDMIELEQFRKLIRGTAESVR